MKKGFLLGPGAGLGGRSSSDNGPSAVRSSSDSAGPNAGSDPSGPSSGSSEVGRPSKPEGVYSQEFKDRAKRQLAHMQALGIEVFVSDSGEIFSQDDLKEIIGRQ